MLPYGGLILVPKEREMEKEKSELGPKCDLKEDDSQTFVRYLTGLDESIANIVELQPYSSLDDLSALAYKVEQQNKSTGKSILSKPLSHSYSTPTRRPPYYPPRPQNPPPLQSKSTTSKIHSSRTKVQRQGSLLPVPRHGTLCIRVSKQEDHLLS